MKTRSKRKPKGYKPPTSYVQELRAQTPVAIEFQIARAAVKWELAVRRFRNTTDSPSGPQLAGRRRAVKMAAQKLRKLASALIQN